MGSNQSKIREIPGSPINFTESGSIETIQASESTELIELNQQIDSSEILNSDDFHNLFNANDADTLSNESDPTRSHEPVLESLYNFTQKCVDNKEKQLTTLNIVLAGKTGVGKSSLSNNLFKEKLADTGIGEPVTEEITKYTRPGLPLAIYDTPGLELDETKTNKILKDILNIVENAAKTKDINQYIHCVLFCINAENKRIEKNEKEFITQFKNNTKLQNIPVIIVITQSAKKKLGIEMKNIIDKLNLNIDGVIPVLAADRKEEFDDGEIKIHRAYGLVDLVDMLEKKLPPALIETLHNVQIASIEHKRNCAIGTVTAYTAAAAAIGASPIPFTDIAFLFITDIAMIASVALIFGVKISGKLIFNIILGTIKSSGKGFIVRKSLVNLIKCIPGAGTIAGATISGVSAGAITSALGGAYICFLEKNLKEGIDLNSLSNNEQVYSITHLFEQKLKKKVNETKNTLEELN